MFERIFLLIAIACITREIAARYLTSYQIERELRNLKFPENQLHDWICLAKAASGGRTDKAHRRKDGSVNLGLFGINDKDWCSYDTPGKGCNQKCQDFLADDIKRIANCARLIHEKHGFKYWGDWGHKCLQQKSGNTTQLPQKN